MIRFKLPTSTQLTVWGAVLVCYAGIWYLVNGFFWLMGVITQAVQLGVQ